jgi:hypothetical protein
LKAEDVEDGLKKARQMVEFNGLGHSQQSILKMKNLQNVSGLK